MTLWLAAVLAGTLVVGVPSTAIAQTSPLTVASPNGRTVASLGLREGRLVWSVTRDGIAVVFPSRLGFAFRTAPPLGDGLRFTDSARAEADETFTLPLGEVARSATRAHIRTLSV